MVPVGHCFVTTDSFFLVCVLCLCSLTRTVEFLGEDSPLGIHVVPYCSSLSGR